ncbi:hypothetical protein BGW36DRAFT_58389 [Talaromyces proteolyticus]|uniref:Uncharacterized protein n=1 Tax=Talaromyces proteolyticus TaxID=1131652 RepID=A0AAD4KGP5_9EURO|nr:uncharacterized protein BGW36DRAFT_58389 [Talaromyces proteolyticus]KAH8690663.1 hypothetical protein BGW36DRAFT_58389 [Talaromyces proteolyticus]
MELATRLLELANPLHAAGSVIGSKLLSPVKFEPGGLYILLSDIGDTVQFHWGLYLATTAHAGHIFHLIHGPQTGYRWMYQAKKTRENAIPYSVNLLFGLKIDVIQDCLHVPLANRLAQIHESETLSSLPVEKINCQMWIREALYALDEEGYIKLGGNMDDLETDAWMAAAQNKLCKRRTVINSIHSI